MSENVGNLLFSVHLLAQVKQLTANFRSAIIENSTCTMVKRLCTVPF